MLLADSEESSSTVNVVTEISVVDFINVALVHVTSEDGLGDVLRSSDLEEVKNTQELNLGNVTVFGAIKVLEDRLKMDAAHLDCSTILIKYSNQLFFSVSTLQVLAASEKSIVLGHSWHTDSRCLVNPSGSESFVNTGTEGNVVEETLGVVSLILGSEGVVFLLSKVKVELTKD